MDSLVLKVVLTPALIGAASLAGRRWGPAVGGWLVGLPLTSAPVLLILALDHGPAFAATAAAGTMAGTISQVAFGLAYVRLGGRGGWPLGVAAGSAAFAASTALLHRLVLPAPLLFLLVVAVQLVALSLMPAAGAVEPPASGPRPRWDLPARMAVATAFVLLLTSLASRLGPLLTGLLSPFPIYGAVLAVFAHRLQGLPSAARVLRGLVLGLFAFAAFFLILAGLLERAGIVSAFAAAAAVALGIQAGTLWFLRPTQAPQASLTGSRRRRGS